MNNTLLSFICTFNFLRLLVKIVVIKIFLNIILVDIKNLLTDKNVKKLSFNIMDILYENLLVLIKKKK
jgi:hypothetical protein